MEKKKKEVLPRFELGLPEGFAFLKSKSGVITTTLQNPGVCQALTREGKLIVIYILCV